MAGMITECLRPQSEAVTRSASCRSGPTKRRSILLVRRSWPANRRFGNFVAARLKTPGFSVSWEQIDVVIPSGSIGQLEASVSAILTAVGT
jgi:hypothetical protein